MKLGIFKYLLLVGFVALVSCDDTKGDEGIMGIDLSVNAKVIKSISKGSGQGVTNFTFENAQLSKVSHSNNEITEAIIYNSNKRINSVNKTVINSGATTSYTFSFVYNAIGQLTQLQGTESTPTIIYNVITDFTYDTAGNVTKVFTTKTGPTGSTINSTIENNITYSGGNIAKQSIIYLDSANGTTTSTSKTISFSNYDGNRNPFGVFPRSYGVYSLYFEDGLDAISSNNYSSVNIVTGSSNTSKNYTYTYNNDGSPLSRTESGVVSLYDYQPLY